MLRVRLGLAMKKRFFILTLTGFVWGLLGMVPAMAMDGAKGSDTGLTRERFLLLAQVKEKGAPGYDPTKDPGSGGSTRTVDYEKLKGLMEKFDSGLRQKGKIQKPAEPPAPVPIPKEYTSPGEPSDTKQIPQDLGTKSSSIPGSTDASSPLLPATEKNMLQQYQKK